MAEASSDENGHIVPTAVPLGEEKSPYPSGNVSSSNPDTALKRNATKDSTPQNVPSQSQSSNANPAAVPLPPKLSRLETDPSPSRRPAPVQKSLTDRPQPRARSSLLGRRKTQTGDKADLDRQPTLTFNPHSGSDSSNSSEDELFSPTSPVTESSDEQEGEPKSKRHRIAHSGPFSSFKFTNADLKTKGRVSRLDGRLKLSIQEVVNSGYFAKTLGAGLKKHLRGDDGKTDAEDDVAPEKIPPEEDEMEKYPSKRMSLNICIIVIGSRGDIQPFIKIGKILKEDYGHRVRIATHPAFREFVERDSELEFFSVGGDPSELMAFMVKNPGLIPSMETVRAGEIGKRRAAMYEMFHGMWRACINSTDDENDKSNLKLMGDKNPFVADAIIANPPSFAPPHIAEKLGVPLHMMFTFPYSPTQQFPHPLANIKATNVDRNYTNFMSYPLVEMMTWQGLGDLINRFRVKTLCLDEVSTLWAPGQMYRLKVPYTYMWSPGLVPKPKDWGPEIDIVGFVFLDLASSFKPPESLVKFLDDGPPPVYIGFGSIVVDDPDKFTKMIFDAIKMAGVRALVSKGWGGLGDEDDTPDNIYMLENTPHDWLFPRVSAVIHHGGAGTTAIGLKCAKPTMIVPFFGDQPFWGGMVSKAKAGAHECIPYKKLNAERLAEGIKQCLTDKAKQNVEKIADSIAKEGDGAANAVRSFHRSLPLRGDNNMRCQILENRVAAWKLKNTSLQLCPLAAELLVEWKKIKWNELRLLRHYEWNDFGGPGGPITGGLSAIFGTVSSMATGVGLAPVNMSKSVRKREEHWVKKRKHKRRQEHAKKRFAQQNSNTKKGEQSKKDESENPDRKHPEMKRQESNISKLSADPEDYLIEELAQEAGHGFRKTGAAIVKSPMDFGLSLTQGFHNAPRLYGDDTVRRPPRVTGFHSGVRAGRDEFVFGINDAFTGLWTHPYRGAKDGGVVGLFHGIGMGLGGLVLKNIAASIGPGAYTMKGLYEESHKSKQPTATIRKTRIVQGRKELERLGPRVPRRKSSASENEVESKKRQETESAVSTKWEALIPQINTERKHPNSGFRASLLGRREKTNNNTAIGRDNSISAQNNESPKKSTTTPINEAEKFKDSSPRKSRERGNTAPGTALEWKEKQKKKRHVPQIPQVDKDETRSSALRKQIVPSKFGEDGYLTNGVHDAEKKPTGNEQDGKERDTNKLTNDITNGEHLETNGDIARPQSYA